MSKCKIGWVDAHGNTTHDDKPAIAVAVYRSGGKHENGSDASAVRCFPICADHANRVPEGVVVTGGFACAWHLEPLRWHTAWLREQS